MLDARLAAYVASAGAAGVAGVAGSARAVVVSNTTPQPFGINEEVNIDINSDGQIDFQIDHDRVDFNGGTLDYLQIDKNDFNGAANPLDFDDFLPEVNHETFPLNGTPRNSDAQYLNFTNSFNDIGGYAVALKAGDEIGGVGVDSTIAGTRWDWQENDNVNGSGNAIRANRLLDEDAGQLDTVLGGRSVQLPIGANQDFPDLDDFIGLEGETRYIGVRVDLNDALEPGLNSTDLMVNPNYAEDFYYGWIGIQITNEADATGVVTGWAYETTPGMSITAGDAGPAPTDADYNDDGLVDGGDFLAWQQQEGMSVTPSAGADGTGDGQVDEQDLALWQGDYGTTLSPSGPLASSVPEPPSAVMTLFGSMLLLGCVVVKAWRRRRVATNAN